jgi:hypothetical protein
MLNDPPMIGPCLVTRFICLLPIAVEAADDSSVHGLLSVLPFKGALKPSRGEFDGAFWVPALGCFE